MKNKLKPRGAPKEDGDQKLFEKRTADSHSALQGIKSIDKLISQQTKAAIEAFNMEKNSASVLHLRVNN